MSPQQKETEAVAHWYPYSAYSIPSHEIEVHHNEAIPVVLQEETILGSQEDMIDNLQVVKPNELIIENFERKVVLVTLHSCIESYKLCQQLKRNS